MSHREKCRSGRNVAGRKVAGRNVAGRNVSQGEMSYNRKIAFITTITDRNSFHALMYNISKLHISFWIIFHKM